MAVPLLQGAFTVGEIAPALFGRYDLARIHVAASTMRNAFVRYQGGCSSRAGTAFVGYSKQTGRTVPPRLLPFQFAINQGLGLEFGNLYMRVIENGAFVTETPVDITGITRANPGVVTTASVTGALSATANNGAVSVSYAPGEVVALAGGTFLQRAQLTVATTLLKSVTPSAPGIGYAPADTITLAGGAHATAAVVTVATTTVAGVPTITAGGSGGTPGTATVTGTTGTGTKFQASVTIDGGGAISAINSLIGGGAYSVNPTVPAAEPVSGAGLAGAQLGITMGVATITISTAGSYTMNASGGSFTQASTSGGGTGAAFASALFGINTLTVSTAGSYTVFPANPVAQFTTTGQGRGATFVVTSGAVSPFSPGDWVFLSGVSGMTQVNGQTYVVAAPTATTFRLTDVFGNTVDTTAFSPYLGGGTAARVFTLTTPYADVDLPFLKFTQSNDVMTLCLVNQDSDAEYQPQNLGRVSNTNWTLTPVVSLSPVAAPASCTVAASAGGAANYQYVVTAVDPASGSESIASPIGAVASAVDIAATAGSITITWSPVAGVNQYNIYKATPGYGATIPTGVLFGFAGTVYGTQFIDSNITADFAQVPPVHRDPFARGQITAASPVAGGTSYTSIGFTINTTTGSGAVLRGVIVGGALSAIIVDNPGANYGAGDTVTVTGSGSGATATLTIGPQTGTYPGTVSYFQQRRAFGYTLNQPDTYFFSQPGSFGNFDIRIPTIASDAITGNPWSVQVNGIQFFVDMPGGLVTFTGKDAWQLTGTGGSSLNPQPITPSTQQAQPQAFNGCNNKIPPLRTDYEILFVQEKGSIVRDASYQFYQNIYTGQDITLNSSHLFTGHQLVEWCWAEEPFKVAWVVRDDGILLSLTFLKPQEITGWGRHDTNGLFKSTCSITEFIDNTTYADAVYLATQRFAPAGDAYMIERMDNRLWNVVEDAWCVDCALALPQTAPSAALTASSATGSGAIQSFTVTAGGASYSADAYGLVTDDNGIGPGSGCLVSLTIAAGVVTAVNVLAPGSGYTYPSVAIYDPAGSMGGSGAAATAVLDNSAVFIASGNVFAASDIGSVIRMGGGTATVTAWLSATTVTADITAPIVKVIPNGSGRPVPAAAGDWTLTAPVSQLTGLTHLAGFTVTGLYDGTVLPPVVVPATGIISLPVPASAIVAGLGFDVQVQTPYIDTPGSTVQGQRKKIGDVTVRIEASRGLRAGSNQVDGSTLSPMQTAVPWNNMAPIDDKARPPYGSLVRPLYTGDTRLPVIGGYNVHGQVALEQLQPLPLNLLAVVPELLPGDTPGVAEPRNERQSQRAPA